VPVAILTSIVTTVIVFFGLRLLEDRGILGRGRSGEAVEVPSLLGMRPEQARDLLKGRELMLSLSGEREDLMYAAGTAAQAPLPGSQAPRGSAVTAVVARGLSQIQVPNLAGLRPEDAVRQLAGAGLQLGPQKSAPSPTAPAGTVGGTEPPAGAPVPPRTAITLVLSTGAPATVPRVTGVRLSRARKALEDAGLVVGKIRYGDDDDHMGGVVLKQDPADGTVTARGSAVDLVVNSD
jgi:serine/threonine-protein kinase